MDFSKEMEFAVAKTAENIECFIDSFPYAQSVDYWYKEEMCTVWTSGFFVGMELLAYEYTKDKKFLDSAQHHLEIFRKRIDNKIEVDHHDMGFLYSLAAVSYYKITGSEYAKETALLAAEQLSTRFKEKGGFIQAWGPMNEQGFNRLIIDCLMNIPLLFWATEVSGNPKYEEIAKTHLYTTLDVIVRDNNTTHHTYFFDMETGEPLYGKTAQGYSDDSCWARGQAWGVYGTALAYAYTKDEKIIDYFKRVTNEFVSRLPEDGVPYWDMVFGDGSNEPRDTSSAAIAVCGILEMSKYIDCSKYLEAVDKMLEGLSQKYTSKKLGKSNVILTDAMYSRPDGHKPEGATYGDYFYMEALIRKIKPDWKRYW
jgi:unsaturated chondroitin disaccharide hydrolase